MTKSGGANESVITKHMMDDAGICVRYFDNDGTVTCFTTDTLDTALCDVLLSIISVGGTP